MRHGGIDGPRAGKARRPQDEVTKEFLKAISLVTQVGLTMVIAIGLGFAGGHFLDGWLGTGYLFLVIGILLGIAAGFWNVYRMLLGAIGPPSPPSENGEPKTKG